MAMNRGAFDFICKPVNFDDLEVTMKKTMNYVTQLKQTIQAIKENNILKMYVDESVLKFMEKREFEQALTINESIDGTVIFIDICSFTSITETEQPDVVISLLNAYFDVIVKAITGQNGYVDKFIGDAVMAVFRGEYHLDRAVEASLAVRNSIQNMPSEKAIEGFLLQVSIGINSGEMISGNIGSAALRRLDYTVIGDVVNTAQRLQDKAQPSQILIAGTSYEKIKESFNCKPVGQLALKNKKQPLEVYEVVN
jgi:class 3 adenylate cyclase